MVQIGTISYAARVTGVADAKKSANELADSHRGVAAASHGAAAASGSVAGSLATQSDAQEETNRNTDRAKTKTDLFSSALFFLARALGSALLGLLPFSGALTKVSGALATLSRWLTGGSIIGGIKTFGGYIAQAARWIGGLLAGGISTVIGYLSSFVSWLAAGSAGALAVGAAIGVALGVFGVWILKITGVLDWIRKLGQSLGKKLPAWARDGILTIIGLFTGPFAAIGAFIVGTLEGGFSEGFAKAGRVLKIFEGAFMRTGDRITTLLGKVANDVKTRLLGAFNRASKRIKTVIGDLSTSIQTRLSNAITGAVNDLKGMGRQIGKGFKNAFNSTVPNRLNIPQITVGGGSVAGQDIPSVTVGGGSLNLPQLQVGGMVDQTGIARVHEGEAVLPRSIVSAAESQPAPATGQQSSVTVEDISVKIEAGDFDPSSMSRREMEMFAQDIAELVGKETNRRAGVR